MQDAQEFEGVGPTTQHKSCIEPTAAVDIDPAADHKGAEPSAQHDPGLDHDPDQATAAASEVDGVIST